MDTDAFFTILRSDEDEVMVRAHHPAVGPWDAGALHAGPPAALLAGLLARRHPAANRITSRFTMEIQQPVPKADLIVRTAVRRPGRKVELLRATMRDAESGQVLLTANEWRIRSAQVDLGLTPAVDRPLPGPAAATPSAGFFRPVPHGGYVDSMEVRFVSGDWGTTGPAVAWMRMKVPLLAGEEPLPIERLLCAADSANGLSASFDGLFVNVDLTVHLGRTPEGEWIGLDCATMLTGHGVGVATSVIHDAHGRIGNGAQSLILDRA